MTRAIRILRDAAVIAFLAVASVALWQIRAKALLDLDDVHHATLEIGLTAENVRKASLAWQQASTAQSAAASAAEQRLNANLRELQLLIARTDASINGDIAPRLARAATALERSIDEQNSSLEGVEADASKGIASLTDQANALAPVIANLAATSANTAKLTADPAIAASLYSLQSSAADLAATSSNAARASGDLADAIHRETRPASFTVKLAGWIVDAAGKVGSILAGFVK